MITAPASGIVKTLRAARVDLSSEKAAQAGLAGWFTENGIEFEREYRLSAADIVDFFVPAIGLAVEVKLRGASKRDVWRQIERYVKHPAVSALALISNLAMGLPEQSNGKPLYYVSLGRAWL
jgi:hypothetical protein